MALNWGAGNSYCAVTAGVSIGATARTALVMGWFYPTTLTATRKLWSASASAPSHGVEVGATTDELILRTRNATTNGAWTTTGVDMVVDEWRFIAVMTSTLNTGAAAAWRVWAGGVETAPTECTVTVSTSPSGNFTGTTQVYIGNDAGISTGWQGNIGSVSIIATSLTAGVTTHPFSQAAYGAITNAEATIALERYVLPCWEGRAFPMGVWPATTVGHFLPLDNTATSNAMRTADRNAATTTAALLTTSNVSATEINEPRSPYTFQVGSPAQVRR